MRTCVTVLEDGVAGDVPREEIGGELDAPNHEAEGFAQGFHEHGLAQPGEALEKKVTPREDAHHHAIDESLLTDEHLGQDLA